MGICVVVKLEGNWPNLTRCCELSVPSLNHQKHVVVLKAGQPGWTDGPSGVCFPEEPSRFLFRLVSDVTLAPGASALRDVPGKCPGLGLPQARLRPCPTVR